MKNNFKFLKTKSDKLAEKIEKMSDDEYENFLEKIMNDILILDKKINANKSNSDFIKNNEDKDDFIIIFLLTHTSLGALICSKLVENPDNFLKYIEQILLTFSGAIAGLTLSMFSCLIYGYTKKLQISINNKILKSLQTKKEIKKLLLIKSKEFKDKKDQNLINT